MRASQILHPHAASREALDVARGVIIKLRVTKDERDAMQAAADDEGIKLSEWIRRRCFTVKTVTTVEITPSTKRRRS